MMNLPAGHQHSLMPATPRSSPALEPVKTALGSFGPSAANVVQFKFQNTSTVSGITGRLACVQVVFPAGLGVNSAAVTALPPGYTWTTAVTGGGATTLTLAAANVPSSLAGSPATETAAFTISLDTSTPGLYAVVAFAVSRRARCCP